MNIYTNKYPHMGIATIQRAEAWYNTVKKAIEIAKGLN